MKFFFKISFFSLTRFSIGQDVLAYHNGNWYGARIVKVEYQAGIEDIVVLLSEYEERLKGFFKILVINRFSYKSVLL